MIEVRQTATFRAWVKGLRDLRARARIAVRIDPLAEGNPGDVKSVGDGVSELRIDYGPGFRLYFMSRGELLIWLLCGGDKSSQPRYRQAKALAKERTMTVETLPLTRRATSTRRGHRRLPGSGFRDRRRRLHHPAPLVSSPEPAA